ncbi:hypothetical protein GCM10016234_30360 [Tianweitania populi]|uniref:Uncharacterized protein n=1 Tax=Tianweitania populi TaxID=1607949 RepID=A0A8J3DX18_9HYPH|nr:hypothetical protein [Tianweitania populi]GHD19110.1 hypothetical protein GCM10016234_30360 [Tianweitania populi]
MKKQSAETNEQAREAVNAEAIKLINQAGDFFYEETDPRLWQDALRFALDEQGASERCSRRVAARPAAVRRDSKPARLLIAVPACRMKH